jgi:hypothetical protein
MWNRLCDEKQGCGVRSHKTNRKVGEYCVHGILHMAKIGIWQQNITTCKQEYERANECC